MQGQEEGSEEMVSNITIEWESKGASFEQIDRLGRREFAFPNHAKQTHGYYVQFQFLAEPAVVDGVEASLKLNDQVMLQHYRRI